jgi:MFS family permease
MFFSRCYYFYFPSTVFGMSQFLFQTPAGYLYDYSDSKVLWLSLAAVATTVLTLVTAFFAAPQGGNLMAMVFVKFLQGAVTSFIPPGLNSITQGIVGSSGMTGQVAINEMMNHMGTALIVLTGAVLGFLLYPDLGILFVVSPIACAGFLYFLNRIHPDDIDHAAARGLDKNEKPSAAAIPAAATEYVVAGEPDHIQQAGSGGGLPKNIRTQPSFNFGWNSVSGSTMLSTSGNPKAESPFRVLRDPILLTFIGVCFLFHTANGTVLPLVMQTLAIGSGRNGILFSGLCIIVAQIFMVFSAKICGDWSGKLGRKPLFLIGLFVVPVRCLILTGLLMLRGDGNGSLFMQLLILSTQVLDGVGAGVFGTMYILVTSDISRGSGRFSLTLGMTTAAMSIGGTVSGYLGEALAQDLGYKQAFFILAMMSLVPACGYLLFMPETLPALSNQTSAVDRRPNGMHSIQEENNDDGEPQTTYAEMT